MTNPNPRECGLYRPGHKTHYIQCNVMRKKPAYPAKVELLSPISLRVTTEVQDEVLYYHDAVYLYMSCLNAYEGNITYAPEALLLWVQVEGPKGKATGGFFPAYLSRNELTECGQVDLESGFMEI